MSVPASKQRVTPKVQRGQPVCTLVGHCGWVNYLSGARTKSGEILVATAADDGAAELWRVTKDGSRGSLSATIQNVGAGSGEVRYCCFVPSPSKFITPPPDGDPTVVTDDCAVLWWCSAAAPIRMSCVFDFNDDSKARICDTFEAARASISGDGSVIAVSKGAMPILLTLQTDRPEGQAVSYSAATLHKDQTPIDWMAVSSDGSIMVTVAPVATSTGGDGGRLRLFSVQTRKLLQEVPLIRRATKCTFSADSSRLATCHVDGSVSMWLLLTDKDKGGVLVLHLDRVIQAHTSSALGCSFSPGEGSLIATASTDKTANVFESITGQLQIQLHGHSDLVQHVDFLAGGAIIATCSRDGTVMLWKSPLQCATTEQVSNMYTNFQKQAYTFPADKPGAVAQHIHLKLSEQAPLPPPEVMGLHFSPLLPRSLLSFNARLNGSRTKKTAVAAILIAGRAICATASSGEIGDWTPLHIHYEYEQTEGAPMQIALTVVGYALNCSSVVQGEFPGAYISSFTIEETRL